jgi:glycosyltransferase involved in cell wall biosynthesis
LAAGLTINSQRVTFVNAVRPGQQVMMQNPLRFSPVVLTPTYNNARTLIDVLNRIARLGLPLIVVNDGSTDETGSLLEQWKPSIATAVEIVTHPQNRGKAAALHSGFAAARRLGYTHALTIDTDGQLDPEQIPDLLRAAEESGDAFVLGTRDDTRSDYPAKSRVGRRVSNTMIWMESGLRVNDSQCGMRVYPLALFDVVKCAAGRFSFEAEIITRAGWAHWPIAEVPVVCHYTPPGGRVSHFKPWRDSFHGFFMHARLVFRALAPVGHKKWPGYKPKHEPPRKWLRDLLQWLNPMRAWRELRTEGDGIDRSTAAVGFATGVLLGNLPIYGFQTAASLYIARRLHLHPIPVVAGSQISTPPFGFALGIAAIALGNLLLHGKWVVWQDFDFTRIGFGRVLSQQLGAWWLGGFLIGLALGTAAFFSARYAIAMLDRRDAVAANEAASGLAAGVGVSLDVNEVV